MLADRAGRQRLRPPRTPAEAVAILVRPLGAGQEVAEDPVEGRGVLDHQAVRRTADDDELGGRDRLGELLAVAAWREDVLVADDDERRHGDRRQPLRQRIVGGEDRVDLGGERLGGATETERSEPTDERARDA